MKEQLSDVIFSRELINTRVAEIAEQVNTLYAGEQLVVICVLKGAFMFFSDLVKKLSIKPELDFVRVASYGNKIDHISSISFTKDVEVSLRNKHVLLVEDIVDTGHTMKFLFGQMVARGAKSMRLCALVDKFERREVDIKVDFPGFTLSKGFIVGYGLDYAEHYRELPDIRILELPKE